MMQIKKTFSLLKYMPALLLLFLLSLNLHAEVSVSRTHIGGRTASVLRNSWCEFECQVRNPDLSSHLVQVRVKAADNSMQSNFYSGSIFMPPETTSYLRFPVLAETAKKYSVEVFCDGKKIPSGTFQDAVLNLLPFTTRFYTILNDSDESPGFMFLLPPFKQDSKIRLVTKRYVPDNWLYYRNEDAILINDPDFSRYSAAHFQAIKTYAAEGGTVVFLNPEGIRKAAGTPLQDLLPVIPGKLIRADELDLSVFLPGKSYPAVSTEFLTSIPKERCVVSRTYDGMPLLAEAQYGLGTVRVIFFEPKKELLQGKDDLSQALMKRLVTKQTLFINPAAMETHLDKLTGFPIPEPSMIAGLVFVYLCVLLVIMLTGVLFHRAGTAWIVAVIASFVMVGVVLGKASKSFGKHHSVLAEIVTESTGPVRSGDVFASCFMVSRSTVNVSRHDAETFFSTIQKSPKIGYYAPGVLKGNGESFLTGLDENKNRESVRISTLLELDRNALGKESVCGLDISPRTSKQFMAQYVHPETIGNVPEPELLFSDKGMELAPYLLPEQCGKEKISSVWLILPGGVRKISVDGKGVCRLEAVQNVIRDEAVSELAETLCRCLRKPSPYLAVILPLKENFLQLNTTVKAEGKRILMIPVRITVATRTIRIPPELLVFSPSDLPSRMMVNGNDVEPGLPIMTGFAGNVWLSLPGTLGQSIQPTRIDILADARMGESAALEISLSSPSGKKKGIQASRGKFTFKDDLRGLMPDERSALSLCIRSYHAVDLLKLSPEQRISASTWYLHSLNAEITGTLDESIPVPAKF